MQDSKQDFGFTTLFQCASHTVDVLELSKMFCHIYLELDPPVLKHRKGCLVQEKYVLYVVLERA
jgi:hypothetical protein